MIATKERIDHTGVPLTSSPTKNYRSGTLNSVHWGGNYFEGGPLDKLPWFNRRVVEMMQVDPICSFGMDVISAPFATAGTMEDVKNPSESDFKGFAVEATSPEVARYVSVNFSRIVQRGMRYFLKAMAYGQIGAEIEFDYNAKTGFLEVEGVKQFDVGDVEPLTSIHTDRVVGCRISNVPNGPVDLTRGRGLYLIHDQVAGLYCGRSRFVKAYPPFWELWHHGGAIDSRRLKMLVNAHSGLKIGYPDERYPLYDRDGNLIRTVYAGELAQEAVANYRNGGTFIYPIRTKSPDGKDTGGWVISDPVANGNSAEILEYPERLVTWVLRGLGIPDNLIQSTLEGGTGTYGGRAITFEAFLSSLQWFWQNILVGEIERQVMKWLVAYNFGAKADFHIHACDLMPFQEQNNGEMQGPGYGHQSPFGQQQGNGGWGSGGDAGTGYSQDAQLPGFQMSKWRDPDYVNRRIERSRIGAMARERGREILTPDHFLEMIGSYESVMGHSQAG